MTSVCLDQIDVSIPSQPASGREVSQSSPIGQSAEGNCTTQLLDALPSGMNPEEPNLRMGKAAKSQAQGISTGKTRFGMFRSLGERCLRCCGDCVDSIYRFRWFLGIYVDGQKVGLNSISLGA